MLGKSPTTSLLFARGHHGTRITKSKSPSSIRDSDITLHHATVQRDIHQQQVKLTVSLEEEQQKEQPEGQLTLLPQTASTYLVNTNATTSTASYDDTLTELSLLTAAQTDIVSGNDTSNRKYLNDVTLYTHNVNDITIHSIDSFTDLNAYYRKGRSHSGKGGKDPDTASLGSSSLASSSITLPSLPLEIPLSFIQLDFDAQERQHSLPGKDTARDRRSRKRWRHRFMSSMTHKSSKSVLCLANLDPQCEPLPLDPVLSDSLTSSSPRLDHSQPVTTGIPLSRTSSSTTIGTSSSLYLPLPVQRADSITSLAHRKHAAEGGHNNFVKNLIRRRRKNGESAESKVSTRPGQSSRSSKKSDLPIVASLYNSSSASSVDLPTFPDSATHPYRHSHSSRLDHLSCKTMPCAACKSSQLFSHWQNHARKIDAIYPSKMSDEGPKNDKLSLLVYYASHRATKLLKIGSYLEKHLRQDLNSGRIGWMKVTVEIFDALVNRCKNNIGYLSTSLVRVVLVILDTTYLNIITQATDMLLNFLKQDTLDRSSDTEFQTNFSLLVLKYAGLCHYNGDNAAYRNEIRWDGLRALNAIILATDSMKFDIMSQLNNIVPALLANISDRARPVEAGAQRVSITMAAQPTQAAIDLTSPENLEHLALTCLKGIVQKLTANTVKFVMAPFFEYMDHNSKWGAKDYTSLLIHHIMDSLPAIYCYNLVGELVSHLSTLLPGRKTVVSFAAQTPDSGSAIAHTRKRTAIFLVLSELLASEKSTAGGGLSAKELLDFLIKHLVASLTAGAAIEESELRDAISLNLSSMVSNRHFADQRVDMLLSLARKIAASNATCLATNASRTLAIPKTPVLAATTYVPASSTTSIDGSDHKSVSLTAPARSPSMKKASGAPASTSLPLASSASHHEHANAKQHAAPVDHTQNFLQLAHIVAASDGLFTTVPAEVMATFITLCGDPDADIRVDAQMLLTLLVQHTVAGTDRDRIAGSRLQRAANEMKLQMGYGLHRCGYFHALYSDSKSTPGDLASVFAMFDCMLQKFKYEEVFQGTPVMFAIQGKTPDVISRSVQRALGNIVVDYIRAAAAILQNDVLKQYADKVRKERMDTGEWLTGFQVTSAIDVYKFRKKSWANLEENLVLKPLSIMVSAETVTNILKADAKFLAEYPNFADAWQIPYEPSSENSSLINTPVLMTKSPKMAFQSDVATVVPESVLISQDIPLFARPQPQPIPPQAPSISIKTFKDIVNAPPPLEALDDPAAFLKDLSYERACGFAITNNVRKNDMMQKMNTILDSLEEKTSQDFHRASQTDSVRSSASSASKKYATPEAAKEPTPPPIVVSQQQRASLTVPGISVSSRISNTRTSVTAAPTQADAFYSASSSKRSSASSNQSASAASGSALSPATASILSKTLVGTPEEGAIAVTSQLPPNPPAPLTAPAQNSSSHATPTSQTTSSASSSSSQSQNPSSYLQNSQPRMSTGNALHVETFDDSDEGGATTDYDFEPVFGKLADNCLLKMKLPSVHGME